MRTTITLPDSLYQKALVRMKERDFVAFSDYLQHLVREDTKHLPSAGSYPEAPAHEAALNEVPATKYPPPSPGQKKKAPKN